MAPPIIITVNAETQAAAARLQSFFGNAVAGMNRLAGAGAFLQNLGAQLTGALTVGAIVNFTRHTINFQDELGKLSQRVGVAVDLLDALRRQGEVNDLTFEEMATGLRFLNDRLNAAAKQGGQSADVFRQLGIAITDSRGALRPTQDILLEIASIFERMPAGAEKTAAAIDLFSRSGEKWIPLLNQGAEGMQRMRQEGGLINAEDAARAEEFNDTLTRIKLNLQQVFIVFSRDALPGLQHFASEMETASTKSEGLIGFLKGLATVALVAAEAFNILAKVLGSYAAVFLEGVATSIGILKDMLLNLVEAIRLTAAAMANLASGNLTSLAGDLKKVGAQLDKTFGDPADQIKKFFSNASAVGKQALFDIGMAVISLQNQLNGLWSSMPGNTASASGAPTTNRPAPTNPIISDEAKKLIADIDKAYAESTQSKIALLNIEEAELKAKLRREVLDVELAKREEARITEIYAARRKEIEDKQRAVVNEVRNNLGTGGGELQENLNDIDRRYDQEIKKIQELKLAEEELYAIIQQINQARDLAKETAIGAFAKQQAEDEKTAAAQRIKVEQEVFDSKMSIMQSAAQMARMFGREGFIAWKAIATAQAIISGINATLFQLGSGDPYSAPWRAAATAAAAATQVATIIATQPSGYKEGGYTGDIGTNDVAGFVHGREFVMNAQATSRYRPMLEAMNSGRAMNRGADATSPINVPPPQVRVAVINDRQEFLRFMEEAASQNAIIEIVNRRRLELGLNT